MTIEDWLGKDNELSLNIWHKKYQHNNESFEDWINRISGGNVRIAKLIKEKKFLFGGRILANFLAHSNIDSRLSSGGAIT